MAVELAIALATLLVEYQYFFTLYEGCHNFADYLCTTDGGSAYGHCAVVVGKQHFLKFNSVSGFSILDAIYEELLALLNLELSTANFYDYVHCLVNLNGFFREARPNVGTSYQAPADSKARQNYGKFFIGDILQ